MKEEIAGRVFKNNQGCEFLVLERLPRGKASIRFLDSQKHERIVNVGHMLAGKAVNPYCPSVFGVGYLGCGPHTVREENGKISRAYQKWADMLRRCYDKKFHSGKPTYQDCTVASEWHSFQCFAEWFYSQPLGYHDDAELDKDILRAGNKVYCPEFSSLIPHRINTLICERPSRSGMPRGVHWNKERCLYVASCHDEDGIQTFLGRYECKLEAFQTYKAFKEGVIATVAIRNEALIEPRVMRALLSYEVRP